MKRFNLSVGSEFEDCIGINGPLDQLEISNFIFNFLLMLSVHTFQRKKYGYLHEEVFKMCSILLSMTGVLFDFFCLIIEQINIDNITDLYANFKLIFFLSA